MDIKSALVIVFTMGLSTSVNAALISNSNYTTDTSTGLDWLNLNATNGMDYADVSAQLGVGGKFAGWHFATQTDVAGFLNDLGGDSAYYYSGWSAQNYGLYATVAKYWGQIPCLGCTSAGGYDDLYTAESDPNALSETGSPYQNIAQIESGDLFSAPGEDYVNLSYANLDPYTAYNGLASALVRNTVPLPASAWLFASGLIGLVRIARRKK